VSNPLSIIADGLQAAAAHGQLVLGILAFVLFSQFFMYSLLKRIFADEFSSAEYYSLSLAGWLFAGLSISLVWFLLGIFLSPKISAILTIALTLMVSLALYFQSPRTTQSSSKSVPLILILFSLLFIVLRLSFVSKALFPMYFDSAQHYLLSKNILTGVEQSTISAGSFTSYYHLGFHFVSAFITFITNSQINNTLLILGQVILGIIPLSFFFPVRYWTRSDSAGIFSVLLAAFGWYMPAHAMDWGKYPALASLAFIPFVLSIFYLSIQSRRKLAARQYWMLIVIAILGLGMAVLLHSRALVIFIAVALTWGLTFLWQKTPRLLQVFLLILLTLDLMAVILFIQKKGILGPLFDPYGPSGWLITSIVLFLCIFAYWKHREVVFACVLFVLLLLGSLFVPLGTLIPGYSNTTLLDRPFVEMILYLPLTVLGGFGLAGLEQLLQYKNGDWRNFHLSQAIAWMFILAVIANALFKYNPYPSACCFIVSQDDLSAIEWINNHVPADGQILVSSTDLNVLPTQGYQGSAGGDAGAWVNPLTGRTAVYMPFTTDFNLQQTLDTLCQWRVGYVYVGKTGSVFNESGLDAQPDKYELVFSLPSAKVYQVTGCP
jgi:hypothetical protein